VFALGVQRVGGNDRTGDLDAVQQGGEQGDFAGLRAHLHRPARSSNTSTSSRCKVRRKVDSDGTAPAAPSLARVSASASAAHSAIAVNEPAPASTAQTASPKIAASRWRTPRRCRGSATLPSTASTPGGCPAAPSAEVSKVADNGSSQR
jgi:hypothetical protein